MDPVDEEPLGWATVAVDRAATDGSVTVVVSLFGEIDVTVAASIRATLDAEFPTDEERPAVVLDLSGVEFMDSAGITLLLEIAKKADGTVVRAPSRAARLVITATGLDEWLPTEP